MMGNRRALMAPLPTEATGQEEGGGGTRTRVTTIVSREEGWMRRGVKNNGGALNYRSNPM